MEEKVKEKIIKTIVERQKLKDMSRLRRLWHDPLRALPFYIMASISHIKPYKISFKTLWGTKMTSYLPEGNTFFYYGYCEANLASFLIRFLRQNMTFLDIGAHVGFYSMLSSALLGNGEQNSTTNIHSFEPTPGTFGLLKENTYTLGNVKINNAALSDITGETTFADYGPGYSAYNTASKQGAFISRKHTDIKVPTITLDQYCTLNKISPDFIKIDAEGFEYNILRGSKWVLKTSRPLITLEMANDAVWAKNCKDASDILINEGYNTYEMSDDGYIKGCEVKPPYTYTNILFVPKEKIALVEHLIQ